MKALILTTLIYSSISLIGQNTYQDQFAKYFKEKDTLSQRKTLQNWSNSTPNDPELFTSYFNYYFQLSKQEMLEFDDKANNKLSLKISDSTNQTVGFLVSKTSFKPKSLDKAFSSINKGIELYPTRLDMRFGKIYALGKSEDWTNFTTDIIKAIDYSNKINNKWTWTNNVILEDAKNIFLESIQGYQNQLYDTQNDSLLKNIREISLKVLEYHPDHVASLSNIAISYLLTDQYDKALPPLLKAEKIDYKDVIVLNNIAHAYKLMGNKSKSIEYYKKTIKYGDEWSKNFAQEQIELLEKTAP